MFRSHRRPLAAKASAGRPDRACDPLATRCAGRRSFSTALFRFGFFAGASGNSNEGPSSTEGFFLGSTRAPDRGPRGSGRVRFMSLLRRKEAVLDDGTVAVGSLGAVAGSARCWMVTELRARQLEAVSLQSDRPK